MKQNTSIKEQVLHPEQSAKAAAVKARDEQAATVDAPDKCAEELDERICAALRAASDRKAVDIVVLDLREIASFTDYFIITSGTNVRSSPTRSSRSP